MGENWGQKEKWAAEDEIVGWPHWLSEHEFEQTPGVGDGQRGLACYSPWGCKESDTTERLNWNLTLTAVHFLSGEVVNRLHLIISNLHSSLRDRLSLMYKSDSSRDTKETQLETSSVADGLAGSKPWNHEGRKFPSASLLLHLHVL